MKVISKIIFIFLLLFAITEISLAKTNIEYFFNISSPEKYKDVVVSRVISTDTFVLESGEKIKLIGLKSPEPPRKTKKVKRDKNGFIIKKPESPIVPIEKQAILFVKELLVNKHIRLEFDINKKDRENRTLAYAFRIDNDTFINTEILRKGFAHLQIRIPNKKYEDKLKYAYQEARREKRGLQGQ